MGRLFKILHFHTSHVEHPTVVARVYIGRTDDAVLSVSVFLVVAAVEVVVVIAVEVVATVVVALIEVEFVTVVEVNTFFGGLIYLLYAVLTFIIDIC